MKALKIIDVIIQVLLIIITPIIFFSSNDGIDNFIGVYFVVGGYQLISCLLQLPYTPATKQAPARKLYQKMLLSLVAAGIITIPFFLYYLVALLFVSPVLAIFYCGLSIKETLKIMGYEE